MSWLKWLKNSKEFEGKGDRDMANVMIETS
jgi:hypothetical protein